MQVKVQLDEILTALETNAFVALELATTVGIQSVSNASRHQRSVIFCYVILRLLSPAPKRRLRIQMSF
jgi:hypothetical protein